MKKKPIPKVVEPIIVPATLPANVLAAGGLTDKKSVRYSLAGISVKVVDGRYEVAATDSRAAIIVTGDVEKDVTPFSTVIYPKAIEAVVKMIPNERPTKRNRHPKKTFTITANETTATISSLKNSDRMVTRQVDGRFPRINEVVPTDKPKATIRLGFQVLRNLLTAMQKMSADCDYIPRGVTIEIRKSDSAAVLRSHGLDGQEIVGVIMPIVKDE